MRKGLALLLLGGWLVTLRAATVVFIGAAGAFRGMFSVQTITADIR